jgi:lysophospholipase L1-like esterase
MSVNEFQKKYLLSAAAFFPIAPFLYMQGQYTRWKVGRLPDAGGETSGVFEGKREMVKFLAIGESTVAGIGAETHKEALTGQFAKHFNRRTDRTVHWHALGESGITIKRTLDELVPRMPAEDFDLIVVALGGNDVFTLNSPQNFRQDMSDLLNVLREKNRDAEIFLANVPMVRDFIALPHPLKYVLTQMAKLHHFNAIDLVSKLEKVHYFDDVKKVDDEFFSDGIHPSVIGYDLWAEEMVNSSILKKSERWYQLRLI